MRACWIAAAVMAATVAHAEPPALDRWALARSAHFTVVTDGGTREAERLARRFERLRLVFGRLWPTARVDAKQVIVIAPVGPQRAGPAASAGLGQPRRDPSGRLDGGRRRPGVSGSAGRSGRPTSDAVAVHEYVHLLVETNVPAAPLWLNEGLAEFFAAGRLDESPAVFGLPHTGHLQILRTREWLPLDALLTPRAARPACATAGRRRPSTRRRGCWSTI